MPVGAARACSCTPFSSSPSPSTPPPTAPVPNGRSTCSCFTRGTAWSPGCWSSRPRGSSSAEAVDETLRAEIRGNAFARAGVETAAWDLAAHRAGVGMAQLVAGGLGVAPAASVPCGVALGIPEDRQPETLTRQVYDALQLGYRRVKIKIAPGWDEV